MQPVRRSGNLYIHLCGTRPCFEEGACGVLCFVLQHRYTTHAVQVQIRSLCRSHASISCISASAHGFPRECSTARDANDPCLVRVPVLVSTGLFYGIWMICTRNMFPRTVLLVMYRSAGCGHVIMHVPGFCTLIVSSFFLSFSFSSCPCFRNGVKP